MTFTEAQATQDRLNAEVDRLSAVLRAFPRGPMGMTLDAVKFSPEFRSAKSEYETAFQKLRNFNCAFTSAFKKEITQARLAKRRAQWAS